MKFVTSFPRPGPPMIRNFLLCAFLSASPAVSQGDPVFKPPVLVKAVGFTARFIGDGKVEISWKRYKRPDFLAYKLVRSSTMHDPVYPENGHIFSASRPGTIRYKDVKVDTGVWYYRLCVITKGGNRWVSQVAAVEVNNETSAEGVPTAKDFE